MRALNDSERHVILALAGELKVAEERDQLLEDLENCEVDEATTDGSRLEFFIPQYKRPVGHRQGAYRAKDGFPVEGVVNDADGAEIDVSLFGDANNRLYELELVKLIGGPVIKPDWRTFKVKRTLD